MKPTRSRTAFWVALVVFGPFLVIVLLLIGWRIRLGGEVNRRLAAVQAAGLPTSGAELNYFYPAVPDAENAALVLTQAIALIQTLPDDQERELVRIKIPDRHLSLSNRELALITDYVNLNSNVLALARSAARLGKSRYPVDYTPGFKTILPHLTGLRELTQLEEYRAVVELEARNLTEASAAGIAMLELGNTLQDDPCFVSQLVRMRTISIAGITLERRANRGAFSLTELDTLAKAFDRVTLSNSLVRALIGERAMGIPHFRMSWADINRLSRDDLSEVEDDGLAHLPDSKEQPGFLRVTGVFERDLLFFLQTLDTNITVAALPLPQSLVGDRLFEAAGETAGARYYLLSAMSLPGLSRANRRVAQTTAHLNLARAAIAVEKYFVANGRYPRELSDLVPGNLPELPNDPFDGKPLRYKPTATGYVLYSVGKDGQDDGGLEPPPRIKSADTNSYDVTFVVER
jgi:hypothetical protein